MAARPFTPRIEHVVAQHELWYRYMPESGNWHGGTFTRWIAALSAAPCNVRVKFKLVRTFSLRGGLPQQDISLAAALFFLKDYCLAIQIKNELEYSWLGNKVDYRRLVFTKIPPVFAAFSSITETLSWAESQKSPKVLAWAR